ncbi:calcium-binding protein [Pseudomonas baetica]|uniref:calcium-binding protein n=1 Tax=Pseudomonas baetica TaxID=674054 RepID=UPI003EEE0829
MAQRFTSPDATDYDSIKVSDIDPPDLATADQEVADFIRSNGASAEKEQRPRSAHKRERVLRALDQHYGPLHLGQFTVSRVELHLMNALVHGKPLDIYNSNFRRPPQAFIDGLQLNPADVERRIRGSGTVGDYTIPTLLFEIATHRSVDAPPLFSEAQSTHTQKIDRLLKSAQKLDIRDTRLPENVPNWVNKQKSNVVNSMGVGLQAFGIYSGLMGISDAIKTGDRTDAAVNAGAVVTELGSLIIERGLIKGAQELIENSAHIYQGFAKTRFGLHLSRGAGLIAGALTLPFDIYFAIKALNDASRTTGKEALDHYVAAGMNLTSAALTLILGTAALAGFAHAGPLGIAAAAILIVGSQIYSAVRQVDTIDDYIDLSLGERLETGFLAFLNQAAPQHIQDRFDIAFTKDQHAKSLTNRARRWLDGQMKDSVEAIVNGKIDVSLKATQVPWFEQDDQGNESWGSTEIKEPVIEDSDDTIDARNGLPSDLAGVVKGADGDSKATFWLLGGGKDTVIGIEKKPNLFSYGTGVKDLTGGEKDDRFLFEDAARSLKARRLPGPTNQISGGDGSDTLAFQGRLDPREQTFYSGFFIGLGNGWVSRLGSPAFDPLEFHTMLKSIENVETLAGARNVVQGSRDANRIVSRGHDRINAGAGDDTIYLMSGNGDAAGETGKDRYFVAHKSGTVTIREGAQEESVIIMDWTFENILKWSIEDTSLVILSRCGKDGELPDSQVIIKDVYKKTANKRIFQEQKLRFLTQDGFQLAPDFPDELDGTDSHNIEVLILAQGKQPARLIINRSEYEISSRQNSNYFINRDTTDSQITTTKTDKNILNTLYIDYDSDELLRTQADCTVQSNNSITRPIRTISDITLQLFFHNKTIKLKNFTSDGHFTYSNFTHSFDMRTPLKLNQELIITMRDGISYRVMPPTNLYAAYKDTLGNIQIDGMKMLKKRTGTYLFLPPEDGKIIALDSHSQVVNIPALLQNTTLRLEGKGAHYYIYLESNTQLHISTPGALRKTSNASTWYFVTNLLEPTTRKLSKNRLLIGHTVIQLPEYESKDTPIEEIYLITGYSTVYKVDLIFDEIYLHTT